MSTSAAWLRIIFGTLLGALLGWLWYHSLSGAFLGALFGAAMGMLAIFFI